ncbi:MAG: hypothetical protein ACOY9Y_15170 [Bacillota bacterium]
MPQITRIRLTNIEYDGGKKMYTDELFRLWGSNGLFNLANGGGKTLLLQLILQVVLPNESMNRRPLSDLLAHKRYTGHIAVEWQLDRQEPGYLLTGFCFTRAQEEEGRVKYFTYISRYQRANPFDIKHLPLMQDRTPMSYTELLSLLKKNLSSREAAIMVFDQEDKRAAYLKELKTYNIFEKEWKNIKVTNGAEGGMEGFFQGARTTRQLLETLMIPAVDEVLFAGPEDARELARAFSRYRQNLMRIPQLEKNLRDFAMIREGGEQVLALVRQYAGLQEELLRQRRLLRRLFNSAGAALEKLNEETADLKAELQQVDGQITATRYKLDSLPYARGLQELARADREAQAAEEQCRQARERREQLELRRRRAEAGNLWLDIVELEADTAAARLAIRERGKGQEELLAERDSCRATLRARLEERLQDLGSALEERETRLKDLKDWRRKLARELQDMDDRIAGLDRQEAVLQAWLDGFQAERSRLWQQYPYSWVENPAEGLVALAGEEAGLGQTLAENLRQQQEVQRAGEASTGRLRELEGLKAGARHLCQGWRDKVADYRRRLDEVSAALARHSIVCRDVFTGREHLYGRLEEKNLELQDRVTREGAAVKALSDQLALLTRFDYYIPNHDLLQVQKILADWGIEAQAGTQWLQALGVDEAQRQAYLLRNPLLPYALILSPDGLKKLQQRARAWEEVTLNCPVPLVVRGPEMAPAGDEHPVSLVPLWVQQVYLPWHKGYTIAMSASAMDEVRGQAERELAARKELLGNLNEGLKTLQDTSATLNRFLRDFSPRYLPEAEEMIKAAEEGLGHLEQEQESLEAGMKEGAGRLAKLAREAADLQSQIAERRRQARELAGWQEETIQYESKSAEKREIAGQLAQLREERQQAVLRGSRWEEEIEGLIDEIARCRATVNQVNEELLQVPAPGKAGAPFRAMGYEEAKAALREIEALVEGKLAEIRQLEERIGRNDKSVRDKQDVIQRILRLSLEEVKDAEARVPRDTITALSRQEDEQRKTVTHWETELNRAQRKVSGLQSRIQTLADSIRKVYHQEPWTESADLEQAEERLKRELAAAEQRKREWQELIREAEEMGGRLEKARTQMQASLAHFRVEETTETLPEEEWQPVKDRVGEEAATLARQLEASRQAVQSQQREVEKGFRDYAKRLEQQENDVVNKFLRYLMEDENRQLNLAIIEPGFQKCFATIAQYEVKARYELEQCERNKRELVERCVQQAERVAAGVRSIDRYARVEYAGRSAAAVQIRLKEWEQEHAPIIMENHINECIQELKRQAEREEPAEKQERYIEQQMSSRQLLHALSDLGQCRVKILKPQQHPEELRYDDWEEVQKWSGGERYAAYTAMFVAILSYTRSKMSSLHNPPKVLVADNPFGTASSPHVLDLIFQMAKNNNVQMICLTALTEDTIFPYFPVVYSLRLRPSFGKEYIHSKMESGFYDLYPVERELERQLQLF